MKLSKKNMVVISFMLFSLFFGAGNLIFPPFLGQNAGEHTFTAMAGFLLTAVVLPVLGVIFVARFDGLDKLSGKAGKRFAFIFTVLIYLSIGPGLGIPRQLLFRLKWQFHHICQTMQIVRYGWFYTLLFSFLLHYGCV